ncbi:hypothetical protein [Paenibacillus durus]|uniref:hypothetical protein n=1 Tax=Paenibacillus durus TaxID=44251 RepID=UPI0004B4A538|nr:hypothetical protein [Paenibacillus durus]
MKLTDRVYPPNGMYDVMARNGQDILAGTFTVKELSVNMKKEYAHFFGQQQNK